MMVVVGLLLRVPTRVLVGSCFPPVDLPVPRTVPLWFSFHVGIFICFSHSTGAGGVLSSRKRGRSIIYTLLYQGNGLIPFWYQIRLKYIKGKALPNYFLSLFTSIG